MNYLNDKIYAFIEAIEKEVYNQLFERCHAYKPDFENPETFSVLTALLARQATLMVEMASSPSILNGHSAPLFLRAMADIHITFSWIIIDQNVRAKKYIEHGLGQAALMIEQRKIELESAPEDSSQMLSLAIESDEAWVDSQKGIFLVDVNVGSWSGENTRNMAIEAGLKVFYDHIYTPFSQCTHSTWYHVGKYNSRPSDSPLNRMLRNPYIADRSFDIWNLHLAAKYVDETFNSFDKNILKRPSASNIYDWIYDEIQSRFKQTTEDLTPNK